MSTQTENSDGQLLDLLRQRGALCVADLAMASRVTATAVRQRLTRLMSQGLIERSVGQTPRGRPSHRYALTDKARRQSGSNFADLAIVLWNELRAVKDVEVRRGLLQRLATGFASMYGQEVTGVSIADRMQSLQQLFERRQVPLEIIVDTVAEATEASTKTVTATTGVPVADVPVPVASEAKPVLKVLSCPYPVLAEQDRAICAVEKMMFSELLASPVRLSQCRLDGHACCQFETA